MVSFFCTRSTTRSRSARLGGAAGGPGPPGGAPGPAPGTLGSSASGPGPFTGIALASLKLIVLPAGVPADEQPDCEPSLLFCASLLGEAPGYAQGLCFDLPAAAKANGLAQLLMLARFKSCRGNF